jgi:hypothetical protein
MTLEYDFPGFNGNNSFICLFGFGWMFWRSVLMSLGGMVAHYAEKGRKGSNRTAAML